MIARLLVVLVFLAPLAFADDRYAELDAALDDLVAKRVTAGGIVVIAEKGKRTHLKLFGEAAPERAMREDTIFRIYSMSKPITAVAALILLDEGKLKLDDPVAKYLPAFDNLRVTGKDDAGGKPARAPTVQDLFTHTAGLSYGFGRGSVDKQYREKQVLGAPNLEAMVERVASIPLVGEPGARWHYSVASDILGRVVEVAAEMPLDRFFETRIFQPLGMKDTGFAVPEKKLGRLAANYGPGPGGLRVIDVPATSRFAKPATLFSGGGGLVSTAGDYLRFALMLRNGGELDGKRILKAATVETMRSNKLARELVPIRIGGFPMSGTGFGLGVSVQVAKQPGVSHGEYGWAGAASTAFSIAPVPDIIVITMIQFMPFNAAAHGTAKKYAYRAPAQKPAR